MWKVKLFGRRKVFCEENSKSCVGWSDSVGYWSNWVFAIDEKEGNDGKEAGRNA